MECLTLEALPKAFTHLTNEVSEIRQMLLSLSNEKPAEPDRWLNLDELCQYHPDKPSKMTVYGWVHNGSIPVHKGGKNYASFDRKLTAGYYKAVSKQLLK